MTQEELNNILLEIEKNSSPEERIKMLESVYEGLRKLNNELESIQKSAIEEMDKVV